jgi:hypothetical protein
MLPEAAAERSKAEAVGSQVQRFVRDWLASQQLAKFFNGQTGISHDTAHRDRIDWIVPRNSENMHPI